MNDRFEIPNNHKDETLELLHERIKTHGRFVDVAMAEARIMVAFEGAPNWQEFTTPEKAALRMVAHKLARILCGNHKESDHVKDIGGYLRLFLLNGEQ